MQTFRSALVGLPLVGLPLIGLPLVGVRLVRLQHQRGFLQYRQVRPPRGPASRPGSRVSIQRSKHRANDTVPFSGCVAGSSAVATCTPRFSGRQDQRVTYVEHASAYPSLPHCVDARFFGPVVFGLSIPSRLRCRASFISLSYSASISASPILWNTDDCHTEVVTCGNITLQDSPLPCVTESRQ